MITAETIQAMTDLIIREFRPRQVILFGSRAKGDNTDHSDVDFLVVMPFEGPRWKNEVKILKALNRFRGAKDVIILTPEEFEGKRNIPGTIAYPAANEGRLLYAA